MARYLHKNTGFGFIGVHDSKGHYLLKPDEERILDQRSEGNGVVIIKTLEENEEIKPMKSTKRGG